MIRVARNAGALLRHTFYVDEVPTSADGTVTVAITKADGSTVTSGTATLAGTGAYTFPLDSQALLNELTVTWSGTFSGVVQSQSDTVQIVGGFYVPLAAIRAMPDLVGNEAKFPTAKLIDARTWFETRWENRVGVAFVRRFARETYSGNARSALILDHMFPAAVYSVTVDGTAYTSPDLADLVLDDSGVLTRSTLGYWTHGTRNVVVEYEHGFTAPPSDVADMAAVVIRQKLLRDHTGDRGNRQYGVGQEGVFVRNVAGPFFNDEANALAEDYHGRFRVPAVA